MPIGDSRMAHINLGVAIHDHKQAPPVGVRRPGVTSRERVLRLLMHSPSNEQAASSLRENPSYEGQRVLTAMMAMYSLLIMTGIALVILFPPDPMSDYSTKPIVKPLHIATREHDVQ